MLAVGFCCAVQAIFFSLIFSFCLIHVFVMEEAEIFG